MIAYILDSMDLSIKDIIQFLIDKSMLSKI